MPSWQSVVESEPRFAARVEQLFDAGRHKTIATTRRDGSPRISGIECEFVDGELRFGSMAGSVKGADLRRDPRFALHSPTSHPEVGQEGRWPGEAKISGLASPAGPVIDEGTGESFGEWFVADVIEVVIVGLNAELTKMIIESWSPERGIVVVERS